MSRLLVGTLVVAVLLMTFPGACQAQPVVPLPEGVSAVWDLSKAYRETTPTRERVCINGLWRWQPAAQVTDTLPSGSWGYYKVPGCWPGITDYMQKDCQTLFSHPDWQGTDLASLKAAWYQREITIPGNWTGRHLALQAEYVNSYAVVYVDGVKVGDMRFPSGEVDLTSACPPGSKHVLSLLVVAVPLKGVMMSFNDTASARQVAGTVARRGLCGDVWLTSSPAAAQVTETTVSTSFRKGQVTLSTALGNLPATGRYTLRGQISEKGKVVKEIGSQPFAAGDLTDGRLTFTESWKPEKLWDIHTPQNQYSVAVSLVDDGGRVLDTGYAVPFGFREFWIDGRDFYLNGTRIFLSAVPLDNAQVGAAWANYEGARESLERLKSFGINFVYTHNYGCEPGTHLSFEELLRAADDTGMLVALSQPHFGQYDWRTADADQSNGYAGHARFYVHVAGSHPSVIAYSMSHNATGYSEDMNPDLIDGIADPRESWALNNAKLALRAQAIVEKMDPGRIVYHHSSGNLGTMHTVNFYTNFAPIQELSDWLEHWSTKGVKPFFTCEYMVPCTWDWTMYRGWYRGGRAFGSAVVPWDFSIAEWNSQFLGDAAFQISEPDKTNLRWEAKQFRDGKLWHRWDYPFEVGSKALEERYPVIAAYITDNWRAFRTWGMSANSPWEWGHYWKPREGVTKTHDDLKVDWENLQRPGFSPDYIEDRYERVDLAYKRSDWIATPAAQAVIRNNLPLLAYVAGKPAAFTSKDHLFLPGETVEKQLIVINNSRQTVTAECRWSLGLPDPILGSKPVTIETGQQARVPLTFELPANLAPGSYQLSATIRFSTGERQEDSFAVRVLPRPEAVSAQGRVALFDPKGETGRLLDALGIRYQSVPATADLANYDTLILGKGALTVDTAAPDLSRVRDGLKVVVFEQTAEALEKRLGFRVQEYGLRQVFGRIPDHPLLAGLDTESLRDWRGEATNTTPRLKYENSPRLSYAPTVEWCGLEVSHVWRCGNRGNVASVLIEKPARGSLLPIVDGGYSLQYSPLLEFREGQGMVLFCQMDVTGRTESDPAADRLVRNLLQYTSTWKPSPVRKALYVGESQGKEHLQWSGIAAEDYTGGKLSADQVLVAGPGGDKVLTFNTQAVADFLKSGGHVLALGLDEAEANDVLPMKVQMTTAEHIASYFEPAGAGSLFAGVGPADVHDRAVEELPLVTGGAKVLGDGVLAQAENANVVFCQLLPYHLTSAKGAVASLRVDGEEAFEGKQSALVTMGTTTAFGAQFGQGVKFTPEVGKTYTLAAFVKGVGRPVLVHLEVERAGRPWDRAVKAPEVQVPADQWTEVHATFQCTVPFPEGWQAYLGCAQDGAQFRADMFQLYEGDYVPWRAGETGPKNLMTNPGFEEGQKPYFFNSGEQYNVRKTFRRSSFLITRLLSNMGVQGSTPLLTRFSTPVGEEGPKPGPSVVRNGDFSLDANGDGKADDWGFSADSKSASCTREPLGDGWALRLALPDYGGKPQASVMLAQQDVPMKAGQWYRISFRAKEEGLDGKRITFAIQSTETWSSFFEYQYFAPQTDWREFRLLVQSNKTADSKTRLQIWHNNLGTLWLADLAVQPIAPPTNEGRWSQGLYVDQPEEWDDPYRFFRW